MEADDLAAREELGLWLTEGEAVEPADRDVPEMIELEKVPRRLWEQTLAPFHRSQRMFIARQVSDPALREIAAELAFELDMAESKRSIARQEERGEARRRGAPLPIPGADHPSARPTVQINIRLRADDHARVCRAAGAVGLRPTTLARALVLNGVAMVLREHPNSRSDPGGSCPDARVSLSP